MERELRRVTISIVAMFLSLLVATSIIQAVQVDSLNADPRNIRAQNVQALTQRGAILVAGRPVAQSIPATDSYKYQRVYSNGPLYSAVTGFFPVDGESTGIEGAMQSTLAGTNNKFFDQINSLFTGQHPQGDSVELTLDPVAQQAAFDALGGLRGAVVVLEPKTGRILAMVSTPSFDPNTLADHDTAKVNTTYSGLLNEPVDPLVNRATGGNLNPPGSTFKLVVSSAAFGTGQYTPDSQLPNLSVLPLPGTYTGVHNDTNTPCGPGGTVSIATAEVNSCNIPFAELGMKLGGQTIKDQADLFGFNQKLNIPFPVTASSYPLYTDPAQLAESSFGQQDDRATPLQMAMVSAGIANAGTVMYPNLVDSVISPTLQPVQTFSPRVLSTATSPATAAAVTQMMLAGVSTGIASGARIPGVDVAGKTGTSQNGPGQPYSLWFTGFAPAQNPQYAIAVVVENGAGQGQNADGNGVAAPIAKKVLQALLHK
ncbi:peptidoglycan D,D-transpeptidase FtsI family protein [Subtercola vilae]|uniref:Penicillin-binding protein 2 n=1 Tax=Subtercola vilae TaxID=2056433 RepID=A0A4T2BWR8_9MICO|nr:penicillin-binding transpeptidase domain-containing protein [Subtercola vilae]TIH36195.1 penicillin-binding protein 2 [Subtercola vilae]